MIVRQPKFGHAVGVSIALPYAHNYVPTPNHTPTQIALHKGADAARRGLRVETCPYNESTHKSLHEHWMRGFNNAVPKADASRRLKSGVESDSDFDPAGSQEPVSG